MKKTLLFLLLLYWGAGFLLAEELHLQGTWQKIDYKVSGTWKIISKDDGDYLVLDKDFKTKSGPDLHLLFSYYPIGSLTNSSASSNSKIVAILEKNKGHQEYKIPEELNWKDFRSLIIHCVRFSHLWAGANFQK